MYRVPPHRARWPAVVAPQKPQGSRGRVGDVRAPVHEPAYEIHDADRGDVGWWPELACNVQSWWEAGELLKGVHLHTKRAFEVLVPSCRRRLDFETLSCTADHDAEEEELQYGVRSIEELDA